MKKRILSVVLVVCMLLTLVPTAFAAVDNSVQITAFTVAGEAGTVPEDYSAIDAGTNDTPTELSATIPAVADSQGKKEVAIELTVAENTTVKYSVGENAPTWDDIIDTAAVDATKASITADIAVSSVVWLQVADSGAANTAVYKLTITEEAAETTYTVGGTVAAGETEATVEGLTVTLYAADDAEHSKALGTGTTDAQGKYTIDTPVAAGSYVVVIAAGEGYAESTADVTVEAANVENADITLTKADAPSEKTDPTITPSDEAISLKVGEYKEITVDTDGAVTVENADATKAKGEVADKKVTITGVAAGTANVTIKAAEGDTKKAKDFVIAVTVTEDEEPAKTYTATFAVKDGTTPVEDAAIVVKYMDGETEKTVTAEEDGSYILTVGTDYTYTVTKDGYEVATGKIAEPAEGEDTVEVAVALTAKTYDVTVNTPDAADGTVTPAEKMTGLKAGETAVITITPAAGKKIASVIANGEDVTANLVDGDNGAKTYTVTITDVDVDVVVEFVDEDAAEHTITITSPTNGTVETAPATNAFAGSTVTITATPNVGYRVEADSIKVTYVDAENGDAAVDVEVTDNAFTMPDADVTVAVEFKPIPKHTVTFAAPTNGTMTVEVDGTEIATGDEVEEGKEVTVTVEAANGYALEKLTVGGEAVTVDENGEYTFTISKDTEIAATFAELLPHDITVDDTIENGTIEAASTAKAGDEVEITVTPAAGYELDTLTVTYEDAEGATQNVTVTANKFTMPDADVEITATFKAITIKAVAAAVTDDGMSEVSATLDGNTIKVSGAVKTTADITVTYTKSDDTTGTITIAYTGEGDEAKFVATPAEVAIVADVSVYTVDVTGLSVVGAGLGDTAELVPPTVEAESTVPADADQAVKDAAAAAATAVGENASAEGLLTVVDSAVEATEDGDIKIGDETVAAADITAAVEELADKAGVEAGAITTVVVPYLDIKVTDADVEATTVKAITFEIKAMASVKVTTDATSMTSDNTIDVGAGKEIAVTEPVTLTLKMPDAFTVTDAVYVDHTKDSGEKYTYKATWDAVGKTITFVNPHGFSEFVAKTDFAPVAQIDGNYYETLAEAVAAVENGGTIILMTAVTGENATLTGVKKTINFELDEALAGPVTLTINDTEVEVTKAEGGTFTYVPSVTPPPVGPGGTTYTVTVDAATNGKVDVSPKGSIAAGTKVTVTVTPNDGYVLDTLTVKNGAADVAVTKNADGTYSFTMPAGNVTVTATFKVASIDLPFTDLNPDAWYMEAIKYVCDNGFFNGTSETTFAPNNNMTRAMFVTVLHRMAGLPEVTGENKFTDVADDYYTDAVIWASENGIVEGYDDGTFKPSKHVTRAEMVTFIYRYAKLCELDMTVSDDLTRFTDAANVPDWALEATQWAVGAEIINGVDDTTLAMGNTSTRAQVAKIVLNISEFSAK